MQTIGTEIERETPVARPARPWRKRLGMGAGAAVAVLGTAAAAWALAPSGGNLDEPAFAGDTWELTVGEEANGDGTFKVCHSFNPVGEELQMDNSLGGAGCETSPVNFGGAAISDVEVSFRTGDGIVVLIDLTTESVSSVVISTDTNFETEVKPFSMPQSGEQLVAVEVDAAATAVEVVALSGDGEVIERTLLEDLGTP